ncbi:MAG: tyrosine--tRNA ligase [Calditrichia bacterium]
MNFFDEQTWRGCILDSTEGARDAVSGKPVAGYIGFDPTADSLHVGSLLQIMSLARLQRSGHKAIALVGGGTGLIGDPSGKSEERKLLTKEQVQANADAIKNQLSRFLDFDGDNPARMVNNLEWLGEISFVDFLRDVGKYFTVNNMLAKESVKRRIDSEDGISFTEFSYSLLQAYDFLVLNDRYDCTLQMGGSDQWGNIVSGSNLIRRIRQKKAYGIVSPLVTTASGTKFGKTEAGTVWLDAARTSPYRFYQFFVNTDDADTIPYLKFFTWLTQEEIAELETSIADNPGKREAQQRLATELTRIVHGQEGVDKAQNASKVLFGGAIEGLKADDVADIFQDVPSIKISRSEFEGEGMALPDLMVGCGAVDSKGNARRLLQQGGVSLNNNKIDDFNRRVVLEDFIENRYLVLRKGRKNYFLIQVG